MASDSEVGWVERGDTQHASDNASLSVRYG
jgi:hypothetical protein